MMEGWIPFCRSLALFILTLTSIIVTSHAQTTVQVDNVLITRISGLPLVEQQTTELMVGVTVGTTNVMSTNGVDSEYTDTFTAVFSLASGTNLSTSTHLQDVYTRNFGSKTLNPGELLTLDTSTFDVTLQYSCDRATLLCVGVRTGGANLILAGINESCIPLLCRGLVITDVNPALIEDTRLKQGRDNTDIRLTVSFDSDPNYASVAGTDLWDPSVFVRGNQSGQLPGDNIILVAVSNYGIDNSATSVWPELQVDIDLTNNGCPQAQYICVNVRKNESSSIDFSVSFIPPSAEYGCTSIDCDGIEFIAGTLSTSGNFAEFAASHDITFDATFVRDSNQGGIRGNNLWRIKVLASRTNDTSSANVVSEAFATISGSERDMDVVSPGNTLSISSATVSLDLSTTSCFDLLYLCVVIQKNPSATPDFSITDYTVCEPIDCVGVISTAFTVEPAAAIGNFPVVELVENLVRLDVSLTTDAEGGSLSGMNLWLFDVFLSNASDCTHRILDTPPQVSQATRDVTVTAGQTATFQIDVPIDMTSTVCSDAPFICVEIALNTVSPLTGDTITFLEYDCVGILLESASLSLTSPLPLDITERNSATFMVDLTVTASRGRVSGTNLWDATFYFSPSTDCANVLVPTAAANGAWQDTNIQKNSSPTLAALTATVSLNSTCDSLKFMCVQLDKNANPSPNFTFDKNSIEPIPYVRVNLCYGVDFAETNVVIANAGSINFIENTDTTIESKLDLTGRSSARSAGVMGSNLWKLRFFTSSDADGKNVVNLLPDPALSLIQAETKIRPDDSFAFTDVNDANDFIAANFNMSGITCSNSRYLCVQIEVGNSPDPELSIQGNTTGCTSFDCKGVIISSTDTIITQIQNGGILVEGFPNQAVSLRVNFTTGDGATAQGTGLWQLLVYTNVYPNGTGETRQFETTLTSGPWVDTDVAANSEQSLDVELNVDLSSTLCTEVEFLCVQLQRGESSSQDFTLMSETDPGNLIGCAEVTCETAGIARNGIEVSPQGVVEHQLTPETFTVSVSYASQPDRDNITGTNLWRLKVFLSSSPTGDDLPNGTYVQLGGLADTPFYSGQTLNFTDLTVNVPLADFTCFNNTYFCTLLEKGDPSNTEYTLEILPECQLIDCGGVALNSVTVQVGSNDEVTEFIASEMFNLTVWLNTSATGAGIDGAKLWTFDVFLSDSTTVFANRLAMTTTNTYTPNEHNLTAGIPLRIPGITGVLDVSEVECVQFQYICVLVSVDTAANPPFNIDPQSPNANIGCAPIDCRGVVISGGSLNFTNDSPLIERSDMHDVTLEIAVQFSDESAEPSGTNLWQVVVFTNPRQDGGGSKCATSSPLVLQGNVTSGERIALGQEQTSLNLSNCACSQMEFVCVTVGKNPGARPNFTLTPVEGFTFCQRVSCTAVVIDNVDFALLSDPILFEALDSQNIIANITLNVNPDSAEIAGGTVANIWNLVIFIESNPANDAEVAITQEQKDQGVIKGETVDFNLVTAQLSLYNFECPDGTGGKVKLCVRAETASDISPPVTIGFTNDTACVEVDCRGVILTGLSVFVESDANFIEYLMVHQITFNISASTSALSTNITSGANLWMVTAFASVYANGTEERYGESRIPIDDQDATVIAGESFAYDGLTWDLDLTNFTCPETNTFFMCVQLMPRGDSTPRFTMSLEPTPGPLLRCVEIECTGVQIALLNLTVVSGGPLLERQTNNLTLSVTATSSEAGSSITGDNLWNLTILICENDECEDPNIGRRRKRATSNNPYVAVSASLSQAEAGADLAAGDSISFNNLLASLDLSNLDECPANEMVYVCVRLEKDVSATPDFTLQGTLTACQPIDCRGVHIASSAAIDSTGTGALQEGNANNAISLRLTFTADAISASVTGTDLWDVEVFGNSQADGSGADPVGLVVGEIGSGTNIPLQAGATMELFPTATLDLADPTYRTCRESKYVCGRLQRRTTSSQLFSVTGAKTACVLYPCTGVLVSGSMVEITSGIELIEGDSNDLTFNISLGITSDSSTLENVSDAWAITLFGNSQSNGLGPNTGLTADANTSAVANIGTVPGLTTILDPVTVTLDMSDHVCQDISYVCVDVQTGSDANPDFLLEGVPSNFDGLIGCAAIDCIGVRIYNGSIKAITEGDPILQGNPSFDVELDIDFSSHPSGADVMGMNLFGIEVFLSRFNNQSGIIGDKHIADIPAGVKSTTLNRGEQLDIQRANAIIDTEDLDCQSGALFICAELFRLDTTSVEFLLNGYDNSGKTDDNFLVACREVECRDVQITDIQLAFVDPPGFVLERTADQVLPVNVTVETNATWADVSGMNLWEMSVSVWSGGVEYLSQSIALSSENQNRAVRAGETVIFPNVQLALDFSDFYCPSDVVQLCVSINPNSSSEPGFSLSAASVLRMCLQDVPCTVTEIVDSSFVLHFPTNIIEYETNNLRFDLTLTANAPSAPAVGNELWQVVRVFVSDVADGTAVLYEDKTINLVEGQDDISIASGETIILQNIEATLNLQPANCYSMPYLCVEVAKGEAPMPDFNVSFVNNSQVICEPNESCRGIVITSSSVSGWPDALDVEERANSSSITFDIEIVHNPAFGIRTGDETRPWSLTVFYSDWEDCEGDDFGSRTPVDIANEDQALVNGQPLRFNSVQVSDIDLSGLICPAEYIYLCVEIEKNSSSVSNFSLLFEPESAKFAVNRSRCRGVEVSFSDFTLTRGIKHEQGEPNHEIEFSFVANISSTSSLLLAGNGLWSSLIYGARNVNGSGSRVINHALQLPGLGVAAGASVTFASDQLLNLSFNDIKCVDMPYLCMELRKGDNPSPNFSLWGVPNMYSLLDCFELDCRGVYIDMFDIFLRRGDVTVEENAVNNFIAINLTLTSLADKENATGSNLWQVWLFFNSDPEGLDDDRIAETQITPLPNNQDDQDFYAGGEINFGPVDVSLQLEHTCEGVNYLCFELQVNSSARTHDLPVLLGNTISCEPVDCNGVVIADTSIDLNGQLPIIEGTEPIEFDVTATIRPHASSADVSGINLWSLEFYLSDSEDGTDRYATAPAIPSERSLSVGSDVVFNNLQPSFNATEVLCTQALFLCMELTKDDSANPNFELSGRPNEASLVGCRSITCVGVVVESTRISYPPDGKPVLESGKSSFDLEPFLFEVTFASETRSLDPSNSELFSVRFFGTNATDNIVGSVSTVRDYVDPLIDVESEGVINFASSDVTLNLNGVRCDQMTYICGTLHKGMNAMPEYTLQTLLDEEMRLTACEPFDCRGVQINGMEVQFVSGIPLLEDASSHEVNFTLTILSESGGASAFGTDLWNLEVFLSPYQNGSNPTSPSSAYIGDQANVGLAAGGDITLIASVDLNVTNLVCDPEIFVCVILDKGEAVNPDFTLEGSSGFEDLQICAPFACRGVTLTNPNFTIGTDVVLLEFTADSEVVVDISVDVTPESASVSGNDLWQFEFFTSSSVSGTAFPSPRTIVDQLTAAQGRVPLVAGQTSTIASVNATLNLRALSCRELTFLCVEVWKNDRASPFYSIESPASQADLRICKQINCVGVELLDVIPQLISPPILIEGLANNDVALSILLIPDPSKAGIEGDNLFEVEIFASGSNTGTPPTTDGVTVQVSNAQLSSNGIVDRNQNTTLQNVQAVLDFSGYRCSDLEYICVEIRESRNAVPAFNLSGVLSGCARQRCGGVVISSLMMTTSSVEVLEGDELHAFSLSAVAVTEDGNPTPGIRAWQIEVFVSPTDDGSGSEFANTIVGNLTALADPNDEIEFTDIDVILDLSPLSCADFSYLCIRLSAPSSNFTLIGVPLNSVLFSCMQEELQCEAVDVSVRITGYTDTTLTVAWEPSTGDFDSYRLIITPEDVDSHTQIKSASPLRYTFEMLIPGRTYNVSLELLKSDLPKYHGTSVSQTLRPSCPVADINVVTSMAIEITWERKFVFENVNSYNVSISPSAGVTPSSPQSISDNGDLMYSQTFSSLIPAQTYSLSVIANGMDGQSSQGCDTLLRVTKPGSIDVTVRELDTTSAELQWTISATALADISGFRVTANVQPPATGADPDPVFLSSVLSYTLLSLLPGTEYRFMVVAYVNDSGSEIFGEGSSELGRTTPVPPENIVIDASETSVEVSYSPPPGYHTNFSHSLRDADGNLLENPVVTADFSVIFDGLSAGTKYQVDSQTIAESKTSVITETSFTTRPSPPSQVESTFVDTTTITIVWVHSTPPRDNYQVTYWPNSTSYTPPSPAMVVENTFTLTGMDPYTTIDFSISSVVNSVTSAPLTWRQRTFATRPDPVQELMLVSTSPSSINVIFSAPDRPNGLITHYTISYQGQSNSITEIGERTIAALANDVRFEVEITSLTPGISYVFSVQAVNEVGTSNSVTATIVLASGDPVPSGNDVESGGNAATTSSSTMAIVINSGLFSDINGNIIAFQVFVVEVGVDDLTIADPPLLYQEVVNLPRRLPYATSNLFSPTPVAGRRKRQIADTRTTFTIGTETECVSENDICNGPLESLTSYRVLVRAYTDGGSADSPWSEPITTRPEEAWFTFPVIVYGIIIILAALILTLCCCSTIQRRRKRVKSVPGPRRAKAYQQDSRFNSNYNNSSIQPPKAAPAPKSPESRPVLTEQFHQHYNIMIGNKQHLFAKEFEDLRAVGHDRSRSEGKKEDNRIKNRFGNILPYNASRVHLSGSYDYINASYITGFSGSKEYIATQGPMSNTVSDFWKMVWEKKAPSIVMLVRCIEGGKEKCDKYWPVDEDPTVFGSVIVTKIAEHTSENWAVRDFRLKVGTETHPVRQYNFIAWPTHGSPRTTAPMVNFIRNVREEQKSLPVTGPMVVHCGAGIGRTGVFIGLDILMQELQADQRTIDVFAVVSKMRKERCNMVQSLVQYIFMHRTLADLIRSKGHKLEVSSIERLDAGSVQSDEIEEMSNTNL